MHLSESDRAILQFVARDTSSDKWQNNGWCRWRTGAHLPWEWDDYRPLVSAGLLERRETWSDVLLKLTDAGWSTLMAKAA